jgi:hypothetical protein
MLGRPDQAATISLDEIRANPGLPGQAQDEEEWEYEYSATETEVCRSPRNFKDDVISLTRR